jgi:thiamine biosynthesis lipoprotein
MSVIFAHRAPLRGFALVCLAGIYLLAFSCKKATNPEIPYQTIEGEAQGSYYRITYADSAGRDFTPQVEKLLDDMNMEVSTYLDSSIISRFNTASGTDFSFSAKSRYFLDNYLKSREVFRESAGAFDPTVMPLVSYWGFGAKPKKISAVDSLKVDSLLRFVGLTQIMMLPKGRDSVILRKELPGVQLDFNAIAQGYTVDEVGRLLEANGVFHYLVDIGGEVLAKGRNPRGKDWTIGINTPREDGQTEEIFATVPLRNRALATSGNYRKFYEVDGVKYSHTINPRTGYPERNTLLSASVFAPDAMSADAYATACMVLDAQNGMAMIERLENLEAYFIIGKPDGSMGVQYSSGLKSLFEKKK